MTEAQRAKYEEYNKQIAELEAKKLELNPYANLKSMTPKQFGEEWSESFIRKKCPNLEKFNASGHDLRMANGKTVEVKSSRPPCGQITFNQCHPYECDYFLFVLYNTVDGDQIIYLVPSEDIKNKFHYSRQHEHGSSKEDATCVSVSYSVSNKALLEKNYRIDNWETLNTIAGVE